MRKNENLKLLALFAVIVLLGVGIAYAALSTTLTITFGKVTQNALTWKVGFTGTSATGSRTGTSATGASCGTATITESAVTVADTTLSKPDDKCTWTLTVKNSGTVGAKLTTITPSAPSSTTCGTLSGGNMVCGNITYMLTSDANGTTVLHANTTLAAGASQTVYLVAKYNAAGVQSSAITQSGAKFTLVYAQA